MNRIQKEKEEGPQVPGKVRGHTVSKGKVLHRYKSIGKVKNS